jgi:hypothetical protein
MKQRVRKAVPIVAAFVIGTMFVGAAWAATTLVHGNLTVTGTVKANNFVYSKAKTVLYNVPGSAFTQDATEVTHGNYSGSVHVPASGRAVAPVYLPQGAIVTKVAVWSNALTDGQINLHLEAGKLTGGHTDMVQVESATPTVCLGTPCKTQSSSISPNKVNNAKRTYGLWLANEDASVELVVYRVAIYYKVTVPGPASATPLSGSVGGALNRNTP